MRIIEQFICGKENNPDTCEDGLFISKELVAVIDGVTAKSRYLWNGMKSGYYGKNLILSFLETQPKADSPEDFFSSLNRLLKEAIKDNPDDIEMRDYPRASIILYNNRCREIWSYGDCQCRINDKVYSHEKKTDRLNAELRAFCLEYCLRQGRTANSSRLVRPFQN